MKIFQIVEIMKPHEYYENAIITSLTGVEQIIEAVTMYPVDAVWNGQAIIMVGSETFKDTGITLHYLVSE
jgi:hypothetical protein